jgi:hypothetical protein
MSLQIRKHSFNPMPWFMALVFGVFLIALVLPGLISLYHARSAMVLVGDLTNSTNEYTQSELATAAQQLELASGYEPGRRQYYKEQATLFLNLYSKLKTAKREREASSILEQARLTLKRSLKLAPGDANLWYLLAEIRALQNKMDPKTQRFLGMSYLTGPREGWIALRRLQFSLRYWLLLDKEIRRHVTREIRTLWMDSRYQRTFIRQFSKNTVRVQKIISTQIKSYGDDEVQKFLKLAKRAGWNSGVLKSAY